MDKNYDLWFPQKKQIDKERNPPSFRERDIWWCQIGVNIGFEIFGKSNSFSRPVLVLKKYSRFTFLGAPLSTTSPKFDLHVPTEINGKKGIIRLDQIRTFDARRFQADSLIHRLTPTQFKSVRQILKDNL
jgi:mRNA interferase MazF